MKKNGFEDGKSSYELEPCPICGSEWTYFSGNVAENIAVCGKCHARTEKYETVLKAAHAWNKGKVKND